MAAAMSANSVQDAHDALLAMRPANAEHACSLCQSGAGTAEKEEVAQVAATDEAERTYSATEHLALLNDAVARETASLSSVKEELEGSVESLTAEKAALETEKSELQNKVDVLDAEKIAAETARDEAIKAHDDYVAELTELAASAERRVARTKAAADAGLPEAYVTDERVDRWMSLNDTEFASLLDDLREVAATSKKKPKSDGDAEDLKDGGADEDKEKAARETAAFTRGTTAKGTDGTSTFRGLMSAAGRIPAAQH